MPANRYFCDSELNPGQRVSIEGAELHHLLHVMRVQIADNVELVNGRGCLAHARLVSVEKKRRALCVVENVHKEEKSLCSIKLVQALPRAGRLDTLLEKTTELGVDELILFPGERSERKVYSEKSLQRLKGVAVSAMKQCGRLYLPTLSLWPAMGKWAVLDGHAFFGDLDPLAPKLSDVLMQLTESEHIIFVVGPEAGFSANEEEVLKRLGIKGVKLHHNVLRTDTASIVAVALISHLYRL